jgi:hypothetical protein
MRTNHGDEASDGTDADQGRRSRPTEVEGGVQAGVRGAAPLPLPPMTRTLGEAPQADAVFRNAADASRPAPTAMATVVRP